jgi:pimeloyl-ACP methyl ester carboxylesterase
MRLLGLVRRHQIRFWLLVAAVTAGLATSLPAHASPAHSAVKVKPTVVLVHGAFADASSWSGVVDRLQRLGYTVDAPANPLEGVAYDSAYLKAFLATVKGPIVLVGHSYGGMVITNAATGNANVKALVYVAAYAPNQGDSVVSLEKLAPGGEIGPSTLDITQYPSPTGTGEVAEATIKESLFRQIFAGDLPAAQAHQMAVSQRPAALSLLVDPSGPPAWKSIPSWYVVPGADHAIGTKVEEIMAKRIHAHTTFIKGASHVVMISHPEAVTKVIVKAADSVH